ncbi:Asp-tRNA(Asn)/Glu-tRNA(Gln) amidotransferase subunit GatA [Rhodoblastus sp.]|jgi:aspartyl-tRNA(Asn)/glutamyl-tRNA(Gln) amidotransferase subunit A|uniref:Asp-tRNA(Asn)/Glu-tRNA(Gln) amidotransferase subunit GatA n=1 Tax=Rhodoblastus sp. TaxID=1962975 RepID=UPI00261A6DA2|nr:Asp-tRNA(Asn)/Glu-tRNA(Gln) amidotransferase subunit GatA [Rhodoblastus sp.]
MSDLTRLTLAEARDGLSARKFSAVELNQSFIDAVAGAKSLNVYLVETPEKALAQAKASDERIARGEAGPLEGIPLGVKDLYATEGVQTTAASHILEGFIPQYESTVTANLWRDGATMLGKLNLDEFAMGSSNETSYFGPAISPWRRQGADGKVSDAKIVPGGSSGGSAAAVAARLCLGATATDTGGSIRQPAAFTGTVGIKPTYGRCSRFGIVAFASSLDQAGPIARTVRDTAILLRSMAGHDPKDTTSVDAPVPDYEKSVGASVKGKVIGIPKEYRLDGLSAEIAALWDRGVEWLKAAGAEIREISLPHTRHALPAYYIVAPAEASSNLARYDGVRYGLRKTGKDIVDLYELTRAEGFGKEVRRRIMIGTYVLSAGYYDAYYLRAQKIRTLIKRDFDLAYQAGVDAILTPATPSPAFALGEKGSADPVEMYLNDVFTVTVNMAGLPGLVVPGGLSSDGLPLGLQLIGRPFEEETLFALGQAIEEAAPKIGLPEAWWA